MKADALSCYLGIVAPVGIPRVKELLAVIADADDARLPPAG